MPNLKILLLGLLLSSPVYATIADNHQPITITSDTLDGDLAKGSTVFSGNVVAVQGQRQLHSNQAYIYFDQSGQVTNLKALGSPAKTREVIDAKGNQVLGQALIIEYFPVQSLIQYEQQAIIQENGNIFKGNLITYNIDKQIVASPKTESNSGNETIILPPADVTKTKS
jgi:lipopolysaccharide export system protein LptA